MTRTATVVGAGIAGPTAALHLSQLGYDVTLCEKRSLPYAGSIHMITLETDTESILWNLGITREEIYKIPSPFIIHEMDTSTGQIQSSNDDTDVLPGEIARWNDVHNALCSRCDVHYGVNVDYMPQSDIVVWADGIGSYGRKQLSPRNGEYSGEMLFRGISPRINPYTWQNLDGIANKNRDQWQMVSYPTWDDNGHPFQGWTLFAPITRELWSNTRTLTSDQVAQFQRYYRPRMDDVAYSLLESASEVTCAPQIVWPYVEHMSFDVGNSRHFIIGDACGTLSPRTGYGANAAILEAGQEYHSREQWERVDLHSVNYLLDISRRLIGKSHSIHG